MSALVDMNNPAQNTAAGEPLVARHRQAELDMLLSPEFARLRESGDVTLVTHGGLIAQRAARRCGRRSESCTKGEEAAREGERRQERASSGSRLRPFPGGHREHRVGL
jgi:hypothetical protein